MSKPQSPSLTIKRKFKAPAEKVFAAWTRPEALKAWFGPTDDYTVSVAADRRARRRPLSPGHAETG